MPSSIVHTAFGDIDVTSSDDIIYHLLRIFIGIGILLAVLRVAMGAIKILTAMGNGEQIKAGKDQITDTLVGLAFVLLAVALLKFIGIDILGLSNFVTFT